METLQIKKLSQAIINIRNKVKFCSSLAVTELGEDEIDGLSRILSEACDELEQAAHTVEMLPESDYTMKRKGAAGRILHAVPKPLELEEKQPARHCRKR